MKTRNASIDIFRIICAIMVIAIHTHPFEDISESVGYVFTQIIPRIAVPFFFCVTGYYYLKKLENGENIFKLQIMKYLKIYLIWSSIYLVIAVFQWFRQGLGFESIIKKILRGLFINGIAEHLWFFLGIFFCLIISTCFYKLFKRLDILAYISIALFIIGLLVTSYYNIGIKVNILENFTNLKLFTFVRRVLLMGFPFFMMGYFISRLKLSNINKKFSYVMEIFLIVLYILEIIFINNNKLSVNIIMTLMLYPLLFNTMIILLKNPLPKLEKFASKCRNIANFTYYSHIMILIVFSLICSKIFGVNSQTINFFGTTFLCIIIGLILEKINNKYINKLYK